jgi:2-polyprenyl-3-methyl-5-hydroxy-6-metoxy-1,4-benzoquinol methylase
MSRGAAKLSAVAELPYSRLVADQGLSDGHLMMIEAVPPGARVLDVGCAAGYLAGPLTEAGCVVTGVEPDAAAAEGARARGATVTVGDFELAETRAALAGPFDAVIFGDVLEHMRDPWAALAATTALLAPGARVVASIPNIAHWSARLALLRGRFDYAESGLFDATHLRFFTHRSARELAERAGYRVEREQFTRGALPILPARVEAAAARLRPELFALQFVLTLRPRGA